MRSMLYFLKYLLTIGMWWRQVTMCFSQHLKGHRMLDNLTRMSSLLFYHPDSLSFLVSRWLSPRAVCSPEVLTRVDLYSQWRWIKSLFLYFFVPFFSSPPAARMIHVSHDTLDPIYVVVVVGVCVRNEGNNRTTSWSSYYNINIHAINNLLYEIFTRLPQFFP